MMLENYGKELKEILLLEDDIALKNHMKKYNIEIPDNPYVFQLMKHKAITARPDLPIEFRRKSKEWLIANNSHSLDDGDL